MSTLDLFAGPGGWDVAARELGLDVLGVEWDDDACATRRAAGHKTLQADVAVLKPEEFGKVTGLIASPPCQSFSSAGKRLGEQDTAEVLCCADGLAMDVDTREEHAEKCADPRSLLAVEPLRFALELEPDWIALEQVPAVLPLWEAFGRHLGARGYSWWAGCLSAEQYGVPQTRQRAVLIARRDGRSLSAPAPTHQRYLPERKGETLFDLPGRRVHPDDQGLLPWVAMADVLMWKPEDCAGFPRLNDREDGGKYRDRDMRPATEPAFTLTEKARSWRVNTGRDWKKGGTRADAQTIAGDCPAPTMTGKSGGQWRVESDDNSRGLAIEEAAILQTFPPDYPWQGSRTSRFLQIGNAVPPLLARRILEAVL